MGPLGQGPIIPEMLLYADKAIELECRSQAVEYMRGHDVNLVRYLLDLKLRHCIGKLKIFHVYIHKLPSCNRFIYGGNSRIEYPLWSSLSRCQRLPT